MAANREPLAGKRLDSWKEIAAFFGRAERTVKRWESERGLPVHRVPGGGRSAVFAYSEELSAWLKGNNQELEADDSSSGESGPNKGESSRNEMLPTSSSDLGAPRTGTEVSSPLLAEAKIPLDSAWKPPSKARVAAWLVPLALAIGLVAYLSMGRSSAHFKALASRHPPNTEAQDLYLKGRYFWERRTPDDLNKAIDYFTQAIVKDPSDAQAYVGLADSYNLLREFGAMPNSEAYPRALSAAQRAVELDDTSAEAHLSLAFGTYWWLWHGATAEREFKRAIELNPNLVRAHHWYATFLLGEGRHAEALDQMEQARRLDPSSNALLADKGELLCSAGRRKEGQALLEQLEQTDPTLSSTHAYLSTVYFDQKDYAKWLEEAKKVAELRHDSAAVGRYDALDKALAVGGIAAVYQAEFPLQKDQVDHGSGSAYYLAFLCAQVGKKEDVAKYLQLAFDNRESSILVGDKPIPGLETNPTYIKLREQVKQMLAQ